MADAFPDLGKESNRTSEMDSLVVKVMCLAAVLAVVGVALEWRLNMLERAQAVTHGVAGAVSSHYSHY
jgi:hypothetical protein